MVYAREGKKEPLEIAGEPLSTPLHRYAGIRAPLHPHRLRSAPQAYYRSTPQSRALPERRFDALGA